MKLPLAALAVLLASGSARAWEASGKKVEARRSELQEARQGLKSDELINDSLRRAAQKKAPAWVQKPEWSETAGKTVWHFGIGVMRKIPNTAMLVKAAENRARQALARSVGEVETEVEKSSSGHVIKTSVKAELRNTAIVDWYLDEEKGILYALAVMTAEAPARP